MYQKLSNEDRLEKYLKSKQWRKYDKLLVELYGVEALVTLPQRFGSGGKVKAYPTDPNTISNIASVNEYGSRINDFEPGRSLYYHELLIGEVD